LRLRHGEAQTHESASHLWPDEASGLAIQVPKSLISL
jgi:hypothetical protein